MSKLSIKQYLFLITIITLLAFALRVYRLDAVDLRGDEAYSVMHWTATPFTERWIKLWREEPAPAGAFVMYWAWNSVVGKSVFATRYLSLLGNLFGLAVTAALAYRLLRDRRLALLVAFLWAVSPLMIWHAQDARVYGVQSALTPLTFLLLLRALEQPDSRKRWIAYCLVQALALYIYYFEILWLAAQGVYVLICRRKQLWRAMLAWIAVGVLIIPVIAQAYVLLFVSRYQGTASLADFFALFYQFVPSLFFGDNTIPTLIGAVAFAMLIIGLFMARQVRERGLLIAWIVIPLALLYILSTRSGYWIPRYAMTIAPALLIAVVVIAQRVVNKVPRRQWIYAALAVVFGVISAVEVWNYYYIDPPKAQWRGLTTYLRERTTANDTLVFGYPDPSIEYYYTGPGSIYIVPLDDTHKPSEDMQRLLEKYDALFLVAGQRTEQEREYLQKNAQYIPGDTFPGVMQYRRWEVDTREIQHPVSIDFGDVARLRGYTLLEGETGGKVLLLYWEALKTTPVQYSILTHVVPANAPDNPPVAALDHGVATSQVSTMTWTPGVLYRDPVAIPVDLPAGEYVVRVGLYESETLNPLPIGDPALEKQHQGRYPLLTFRQG